MLLFMLMKMKNFYRVENILPECVGKSIYNIFYGKLSSD